MTTTTARAAIEALLSVEPYPANDDDVLVNVTITSLQGETLPRPLYFYVPVGLTLRMVEPSFVVMDAHPASSGAWEYDDDDRLTYRFADGEAVTLGDGVIKEVKTLVGDFIWRILSEAADAHRAVLREAGLVRSR